MNYRILSLFTFLVLILFACNNSEEAEIIEVEINNPEIDTLIEKWSTYYDKLYELSEVARSYMDTLTLRSSEYVKDGRGELNSSNTIVYQNDKVVNISSEMMTQKEKQRLLSIITNFDSTAFVRIRIPFGQNLSLHFGFNTDNKLWAATDMYLEDGEWTHMYEQAKKKTNFKLRKNVQPFSVNINNEYIIIRQSFNIKLEDVKPLWLNFMDEHEIIKGTLFNYGEKVSNNDDKLRIFIWLPHRTPVK